MAKAGDTKIGTLNLPANGLVAGTNQFVLSSGNLSIGTSSPPSKLMVQEASDADAGLRVTDGTAASNIVLQPLTGTLSGFQAIAFNGYFNGSEQPFNTLKNRWRMFVDQRGTTDQFGIDTYDGTTLATPFAIARSGTVTIVGSKAATDFNGAGGANAAAALQIAAGAGVDTGNFVPVGGAGGGLTMTAGAGGRFAEWGRRQRRLNYPSAGSWGGLVLVLTEWWAPYSLRPAEGEWASARRPRQPL